jgi:hypothetical protein
MPTSDDDLAKLSFEIDDIIDSLVMRYEIDPLSVTAVILARLVLTNDYTGSGDDFRKLLADIPNARLKNPDITTQVH